MAACLGQGEAAAPVSPAVKPACAPGALCVSYAKLGFRNGFRRLRRDALSVSYLNLRLSYLALDLSHFTLKLSYLDLSLNYLDLSLTCRSPTLARFTSTVALLFVSSAMRPVAKFAQKPGSVGRRCGPIPLVVKVFLGEGGLETFGSRAAPVGASVRWTVEGLNAVPEVTSRCQPGFPCLGSSKLFGECWGRSPLHILY